ncbi:hypothetical protein, partial [Parabacteroides sp. PF5-6]|uniref:hypothetical protein n=1 Tax=Parabacteroides sp. PF5-6 TaxID=1742403 RepID=UPI002406B5B7
GSAPAKNVHLLPRKNLHFSRYLTRQNPLFQNIALCAEKHYTLREKTLRFDRIKCNVFLGRDKRREIEKPAVPANGAAGG